jgi:hypothetical protein
MKIVKKVGERLLPDWLAAELRPILVFTGAGAALVSGSVALAVRAWEKLRERLSAWESAGAIAIGAYVAAFGCVHAPHIAHFAIPGTVIAWCLAAWCVAPTAPRAEPAEQPVEAAPGLALAELAAVVRRVARHRQGAHLADLLAEPELAGWTQPELKAAITGEFGLPVEEFKLILGGRQRVRDGVRVRDLPKTPAPAPPVEAPQGAPADPAPHPLPVPSSGPE